MSKPDPLADAFAVLPDAATKSCPIGRLLDSATPEGRSNLQRALDLPRDVLSNQEILRRLDRAGLPPMNKDTLGRHRNQSCRCPKEPT